MKTQYALKVYPVQTTEGEEWIAEFPAFQFCIGGGSTPQDAVKDAFRELEITIAEYEAEGRTLPKTPQDNEYSGRFSVRTSPRLHGKIAECALDNNISLNQFVVETLGEAVGENSGRKNNQTYYNSTQNFNINIVPKDMGWERDKIKRFDLDIGSNNEKFIN